MFQPSIPPIEPGDEIRAGWLNKVRSAALAMLSLRVEAPLELVRSAGGLVLRLVHNPRFWIRISSGTQPYAWVDLYPSSAGSWSAGSRSGTAKPPLDPAYEQNGNTAVPAGLVVLARRAWGSGAVTFQLGACATGQPSPGVTPGYKLPDSTGSAPPIPPRMLAAPPENFSGRGSAGVSAMTGGGP